MNEGGFLYVNQTKIQVQSGKGGVSLVDGSTMTLSSSLLNVTGSISTSRYAEATSFA